MSARHIVIEIGLGRATLVAKGESVTGLCFSRHARRPALETFGPTVDVSADALLGEAAHQSRRYLAGERREFDLPLASEGDAFQHAVRDIVKTIQRGDTSHIRRPASEAGIAGTRADSCTRGALVVIGDLAAATSNTSSPGWTCRYLSSK